MAKKTMMVMGQGSGPPKDWQAEGDAHALALAKEIASDPKRLKAAAAAASKIAEAQMASAKAMKSVAKKSK